MGVSARDLTLTLCLYAIPQTLKRTLPIFDCVVCPCSRRGWQQRWCLGWGCDRLSEVAALIAAHCLSQWQWQWPPGQQYNGCAIARKVICFYVVQLDVLPAAVLFVCTWVFVTCFSITSRMACHQCVDCMSDCTIQGHILDSEESGLVVCFLACTCLMTS